MEYNFDNLPLEKGMYNHAGMTFGGVLESLDPSEKYVGSAMEGLDAYERQLKRFDIRVGGSNASTVEKFFENSQTAVLFPEFVARAVKAGLDADTTIPAVVATVSEVDGVSFNAVSMPSGSPALIEDAGDEMTEAVMALAAAATPLKRYGLCVAASYDALRAQKLDALAVLLGSVGEGLAKKYLADAVTALKTGATAYTIGTSPIGGTKGTMSYGALIDFWNTFTSSEMNTMLVSRDVAVAMLKLSEFQNAAAGLDFQATGRMITPLGATMIPCSALSEGEVIGLDRTKALEMAVSPAVCVETDKLINRRLDRIAVSGAAGFAKLCSGAVGVLKV